MREKSAGISISEDAIRVAIVVQDNGSIVVDRIEEIRYEDFNSLNKDREVAASLKKIFERERVSRKIIVSIPDDRIIIRAKTLPPINEQKVLKLIQTEIKDYAIFSGENVALGFTTSRKEQDKALVIWGASKESNVLSTLQFLHNAGLRHISIVPSNFALARAVSLITNEDKPYCVVNVDRDTTSLTFVDNGKVIFTYTQDIGFRVFDESDIVGKNTWVGNIITTVTYATRTFGLSIKEIFLTAATAKTDEILATITQKVSYPVILLNIPEERVDFKDEEIFVKMQATGGNEFACAIGLALLSSSRRGDPLLLNVNEHFLRERSSDRLKTLTTVLVLVVVNAAAVVAYPIIKNALDNTQSNLESVKRSISEISVTEKDAVKLSQELQSAKDILSKFNSTKTQLNNRAKLSQVLKEMSALRPGGLSLLSVAIGEDGKIVVRGSAQNIATVLAYEENLAKAKYVQDASIGSISQGDSSQGYVFDMQILLSGVNKQ